MQINVTRNALIRELMEMALSHIDMAPEYVADAKSLMRSTDQFWPFDNDGSIDRALNQVNQEYGKEILYDAVQDVAGEVYGTIISYYTNPWNFAPGYQRPEGLEWCAVELDKIQEGAVAIWERVIV